MSTKLAPLFDVRIEHRYFATGECRAVELRPLPDSIPLFDRYGLRWHPERSGGSLHRSIGADAEDDRAFSRRWRETAPIRFGMWIADPHFGIMTDRAFAWEWGSAAQSEWPVLFSNDGVQVSRVGSPAHTILLHDPAAPCRRRIAPDTLGRSMAAASHRPFAVVEIHLGGAGGGVVPDGGAVLDASGNLTPRHYGVSLATRSAFVRYRISQPPAAPLGNVHLTLEGQIDAAFVATPSASPDARTVEFISDRALPLLESPGETYRVTMIDRTGRGTTLPYASAQGTRVETDGEGAEPRFVSDVYVQL